MGMKRILVCLDASDRALHVMRRAAELADRLDAKLVLFRAVGVPPPSPLENVVASPSDLPGLLLEKAAHDLESFAKLVPAERLEGAHEELGIAWDAICAAAKKYEADLIVIGSHGYGGLDRLLGTTAAKVVNHADRDVLVVRSRS